MIPTPLMRPVLISGILFGVITALPPFNAINYCTCCSMFAVAGAVAAVLLRRESVQPPSLGTAAQTGLCSGLLGGVVNSAFSVPVALLLENLAPNRQVIEQVLEKLGDDQSLLSRILREYAAQGADRLELFSAAWLLGIVLHAVLTIALFSLFATLGAILTVALLDPRPPATVYVAPPPPPVPASPPPVEGDEA